jgi:predicted SAM-dependent methyltransferase
MSGTTQKLLGKARRLLGRSSHGEDGSPSRNEPRMQIANRYLQGEGIEVGALNNPLEVPKSVKVRYVDRMSVEKLRQHYPELAASRLVDPDIIDNGEQLTTIPDASQDFIIANHFLEHCQDVIGTLKQFFRVLRPGGILYAALPDKRFTFDKPRKVTPLQHFWVDHLHGAQLSRQSHFEDWVQGVNGDKTPAEQKQLVQELIAKDYSIHFHVWTQSGMIEMFHNLQSHLNFEFELIQKQGIEVIFVLRKV